MTCACARGGLRERNAAHGRAKRKNDPAYLRRKTSRESEPPPPPFGRSAPVQTSRGGRL
ncbi:hypothetical protein T484DRAFT_1950262 [Baffinella frigidus]|nr:hypothetical protein T484DRAFT_1950262 [Cryptophyta sp. CCMP2293]